MVFTFRRALKAVQDPDSLAAHEARVALEFEMQPVYIADLQHGNHSYAEVRLSMGELMIVCPVCGARFSLDKKTWG